MFENLLKRLVRNRYKDDLHSAMCYFKSGTVAFIQANFDKTLTVFMPDDGITVDCRDVSEVVNLFKGNELTRFST